MKLRFANYLDPRQLVRVDEALDRLTGQAAHRGGHAALEPGPRGLRPLP
jgi:hypothetical protein